MASQSLQASHVGPMSAYLIISETPQTKLLLKEAYRYIALHRWGISEERALLGIERRSDPSRRGT